MLVFPNFKRRVTFKNHLEDNLTLMGWQAELGQVFVNLMVNACHAIVEKQEQTGDETPGLLEVETTLQGMYLIITIRDSGKGMDSETREHIFEPFFTTKPTGKGTGLGLAIVHEIIDKHEGTIEVVSEAGKGTTFTIQLPVEDEIATQDPEEET